MFFFVCLVICHVAWPTLHSHVWCHYSSDSAVKISVLETGGEGKHREGGMEGEAEGGTDGGYLWLLQAPMRFWRSVCRAWTCPAGSLPPRTRHTQRPTPARSALRTHSHSANESRASSQSLPSVYNGKAWNLQLKLGSHKIYLYVDTHSFVSDQIMGDWWPSIILFSPFHFERIAFGL